MTCPYELNSDLPQCSVFSYQPYKNVEAFLDRASQQAKKNVSVILSIGCIEFDRTQKEITINKSNCVTCGSCVSLCPGARISFDSNLKAEPSCSAYPLRPRSEIERLKDRAINLSFERLESAFGNYDSLEDYTSVNETKNISVWGATLLKSAFSSNSEVGLEIPLTIQGRDRDGRLDICVVTEGALIVFESKVNLKKMLAEGRYISQILAYEEELETLGVRERFGVEPYKLLLIGGDETDLLPPEHPRCTGKIGRLSEIFYEAAIKHRIKFISARGLLSLSIQKLLNPAGDSLKVIRELDNEDTLGILAGKLVKNNRTGIELIDFLI